MHTLLEGKAMWDNIYSKRDENKSIEVTFVLSINGTRFLTIAPPGIEKPTNANDLTTPNNSYVSLLSDNTPNCLEGKCKFPEFMVQFPNGNVSTSDELLQMNKTTVAQAPLGGKRTRRMRMRKTRKQHKKKCKCVSCVCKKRKSRRRTKRSYRRR